jgi:hypothetical protein
LKFRIYKFAVGLLATAWLSYAGPIDFIFQGIGSGSVGTAGFTSVPFRFTQSSDTNLITGFVSGPAIIFETPAASGATIAIAGFGTGTVSTVTQVLDLQQPPSSFISLAITATGGDIGGRDAAFDTYDLQSAFGPIITPSQFATGFTVASTLGTVSISAISSLTFSAVPVVTTVPEPGTPVTLGVGLLLGFAFIAEVALTLPMTRR